jgi:hypothetical protein
MKSHSEIIKPPPSAEDDPTTIAVRAYIEREPKPTTAKSNFRFRPAPLEPSALTLTFDTETHVDAAQHLRFGTYQMRDGDSLDEEGLFFDDTTLPNSDQGNLRQYGAKHELIVRPLDDFIASIFYGFAYDLGATIVGFNLPFDISRIALGHSPAKSHFMKGGFSFVLTDDPRRGRVQVKPLSGTASVIRVAAPAYRPVMKRFNEAPASEGHFVDVRTLAAALTNRSFSLKTLAEFLRTKHRKLDSRVVAGPISVAMIRYALRDTQVTWECFRELNKRYLTHGLTGTPVHRIYSVASVGKAYFKQMGVKPWL